MGRKRKSISEDERPIQANQRRRERYAKKAAEKQQRTQQSKIEYENKNSQTSHAIPFSPIDDTLVHVSIRNDVSLSALLKAKCTCFQVPVLNFSYQSAMDFSLTNDAVHESILLSLQI